MLSSYRTLSEMPDLSSDRMTHLELSYHRYLLEAISFMKTSTTKNSQNRLSLALGVLTAVSCATSSQSATAVTLVGNEANAVTSGSFVSGRESASGFYTYFPVNPASTVASVLGFVEDKTSVELGNPTNRSTIELNWGGSLLQNQTGNDLAIYESGSLGKPEPFAVAIRKQGETNFTNFLYKFTAAYNPDLFAFVTLFDLRDFGLGDGDAIDAIRISNAIATDRVTGQDGQGFLGGQYTPQTGVPGSATFTDTQFDPDITYVVGLHNVVVPRPQTSIPEPSSMLGLLAFGAFGVNWVPKRKQQQKA
ncbi:PEP-CTERM sorting domain-containing protein [Microseira sp. BLCC-F43]|uniref:PEP-CTERM sorting domain-containing protein n=1 Tax=Microseira sp. BLCC-F43 TaxID=3153602 RepID=UPI0035BBC738